MNQALIDEINIEIYAMSIIVDEVESLLSDVGNSEPTNVQKTALGGFVSQFYNGIENIFKRIHKSFNIEIPKGNDWHISLVNRFSKDSGFDFPIELSDDLLQQLNDYRRFRHYFFHGYSHNLNWEILSNSVKDIREVFDGFKIELKVLMK